MAESTDGEQGIFQWLIEAIMPKDMFSWSGGLNGGQADQENDDEGGNWFSNIFGGLSSLLGNGYDSVTGGIGSFFSNIMGGISGGWGGFTNALSGLWNHRVGENGIIDKLINLEDGPPGKIGGNTPDEKLESVIINSAKMIRRIQNITPSEEYLAEFKADVERTLHEIAEENATLLTENWDKNVGMLFGAGGTGASLKAFLDSTILDWGPKVGLEDQTPPPPASPARPPRGGGGQRPPAGSSSPEAPAPVSPPSTDGGTGPVGQAGQQYDYNGTITVWGDSHAQAMGGNPDKGVGALLRHVYPDAKIVGLGVDSTGLRAGGLKPITNAAKGSVVLMKVGGNDIMSPSLRKGWNAPKGSPEWKAWRAELSAYADQMIEQANIARDPNGVGGLPIIIGMQKPRDPNGNIAGYRDNPKAWNKPGFVDSYAATVDELNGILREKAGAEGIVFSDIEGSMPLKVRGPDGKMHDTRSGDNLHLTAYGYYWVAEKALKDAGLNLNGPGVTQEREAPQPLRDRFGENARPPGWNKAPDIKLPNGIVAMSQKQLDTQSNKGALSAESQRILERVKSDPNYSRTGVIGQLHNMEGTYSEGGKTYRVMALVTRHEPRPGAPGDGYNSDGITPDPSGGWHTGVELVIVRDPNALGPKFGSASRRPAPGTAGPSSTVQNPQPHQGNGFGM